MKDRVHISVPKTSEFESGPSVVKISGGQEKVKMLAHECQKVQKLFYRVKTLYDSYSFMIQNTTAISRELSE